LIVQATESEQLKHIVPLAVETAMRRSELLSIQWENVDLDRRSIYLDKTKNGLSRTVPLSPRALHVLQNIGPAPQGQCSLSPPRRSAKPCNGPWIGPG
jgi:site-specific recombinase XerD